MSRIGKLPIAVPPDVRVKWNEDIVEVSGPKGALRRRLPASISLDLSESEVVVRRGSDSKMDRALHGTLRALLQNMVDGVSKGFERTLEIDGVGYRARAEGKGIVLELGYSHPIFFIPPEGVTVVVASPTELRVTGIDKEVVGLTAAKIRSFRTPEVYTGKGVRFRGEHVRRKAGKGGART
ncbi:50S ribosomal protein L6 [Candidatus Fermentibacteria bacterium]|nr:50S ribosomal protein L6 [Candidatus Fermentibacteria bacterium]